MSPVLVFSKRCMFLNPRQCKASLSVIVCMIVLVHSCLQYELGLFPVDIMSNAVDLVGEQRLGIELLIPFFYQF